MKIPFFDYPRVWNDDRENFINIIDKVSAKGGFILQQELFDFEKELANYTKSKYAIGVGNATDAMEIFLLAIGLKKSDEIIISSHTMLATASAIIMAGGVPVPVDIGEDNLINPQAIEDAITPNTVGIMPTQLNGRICEIDTIQKIADKYKLFIVEDAAQALGAKYNNKYAGTFGLAAAISFFPAKVLGCFGDAGAILVQDKSLYHKMYQLHEHGRDVDGKVYRWGRNSRMDNVQAAILSYKLKQYNKVIKRRRDIAQMYQDLLGGLEELSLPEPPITKGKRFDIYQNYELTAKNRDELQQYLKGNGIGTLIQWGGTAIHQFKQLGFKQDLPKTEKFFKECIMLPMNIFISDDDVQYIASKIHAFYQK